jgi:hydrogenase nickel incorporation protein HypA/HybF
VHEYSIVQALIDKVAEEARSRGAVAIRRVEVRIGELSGVDPELLKTAYETFRDGTVCREAALEVLPAPACWVCPDCGAAIPPGTVLRCGGCDRPARLSGGDEILLERIEMEVE